jgi:hypothetical protein
MGLMKKLSLYIFLGFLVCNTGFADELRSYRMGEYSYGDSLLKYFSKSDILKYKQCQFVGGDEFCTLSIRKNESTDIYDGVQFVFKLDDPNLIIHSLHGRLHFDIWSECVAEQEKIYKFYRSRFKKIIKSVTDNRYLLKTFIEKPNFVISIYYYFKNGSGGQTSCYSVTDKFLKENSFHSSNIYLSTSISSKEYLTFHSKPGITKEYIKKNK